MKESTQLIQQQIDNVSKLIVTEGHFAEVYTYKDSQQLFGPLITADKKALVVVNAEVTLAYDLSKIEFRVEGDTKTLHIVSIPEPEIKIHPDFEYYDVSADYFNPFDASDYNAIKTKVRAILIQKIATSSLKSNAQNRLISELQKFYILTHSMYSYRDHSIFLANRSRYAFLFDLPRDDYKRWAKGLRQAGYATDKRYPQKLIQLIERHRLHKFDRAVLGRAYGQSKMVSGPERQVYVVKKGDTLYSISRRYLVSVDDLKRWNGIRGNTISIGQEIAIKSTQINK